MAWVIVRWIVGVVIGSVAATLWLEWLRARRERQVLERERAERAKALWRSNILG